MSAENMSQQTVKRSLLHRFIKQIEIIGNKLPDPFLLFVLCIVFVLAAGHFFKGVKFDIPGSKETASIKTLLNVDGIIYMFKSLVPNFVSFPPIGLVIPIVIGVGIGEGTGLFRAAIIKLINSVPKKLVTAVFFFCGINGNLASDASVIIFPIIGAAIFKGMKRNPLIGIFAGYSAYLGGLSANILIAGTDATAAGITQKAIEILDITKSVPIHPAINWYFMFASAFLLTLVGTFVTEKIVAPMLDKEEYDKEVEEESLLVSEASNRGLKFAGIAVVLFVIMLVVLGGPENAILRNPETGTLLPKSPFMSSIVPFVVIFFISTGIAYGLGAKTIKSSYDIMKFMGSGVKSMAGFIVLCFFAAQFIDYFNKTNLSTFIAVKGATFLTNLGFTGLPLLLSVIIFVCMLNIVVISSSAKWAMLAPVLVPMLALMGFSPAFSQCAYRVGDAVTNPISPISAYVPIVLGFIQQYKKDAGIGTVIAYELPYSISFLLSWMGLFIVWYLLKLPLGPGAQILL